MRLFRKGSRFFIDRTPPITYVEKYSKNVLFYVILTLLQQLRCAVRSRGASCLGSFWHFRCLVNDND